MYEKAAPLRGYLEIFSVYVLTQAIQEFRVLIGIKRQRYGSDGYENFLPDDRLYDAARAETHLVTSAAASEPAPAASEFAALTFPPHSLLTQSLCQLPRATQKLLFFVPYHVSLQGEAGSRLAASWQECKKRITRIASGIPNATVVDFMIPSPITREATHYWDQLHYREGIAE